MRKYKLKRVEPGRYDVLANNGPRTRYHKIGEIVGKGTKWTLGSDTYKSKKLAYEAAIVEHECWIMAAEEAQDDEPERPEPTEEQIDNWPEGAVFKKGEILRHAMGYEGPCESAYQRDGYIAYYIKIRTTSIGGPAHVFKRVEVE